MTTIQAKVIEANDSSIRLSAPRQGGCSKCAQKTYCALTWQPGNEQSSNTDVELATQVLDRQLKNLSEHANFQVGDTVTLACNEQKLLRYISLLFLPSLLMIMAFVLVIGAVFNGNVPTLFILASLVSALFCGGLVSRFLLAKFSGHLITDAITPSV